MSPDTVAHPPLQAVFFDLDGTLLDTAQDFAFVLNRMREKRHLPPLPFDPIRRTVSNGARALVQLGFGIDENAPEFEALRQELLALYEENLVTTTQPFDGIKAVLTFIQQHGLRWGVVTNKPVAYAEPLLQAMPIPPWDTLICPDHVSQRKPHPEPMLLACRRVGCEPATAVYVGDHQRDIDAGRNAGMQTVACRYGYIDSEQAIEQWRADVIVDCAADLIPILQNRLG